MLPLTLGFGAAVDSSVSSQWLRFCYDIFQKEGNEKIIAFLWNNGFHLFSYGSCAYAYAYVASVNQALRIVY